MKKRIRFSSAKDTQLDNKIKETMNREFQLPKQVEAAKQEAFDCIRSSQLSQESDCDSEEKRRYAGRKRGFLVKPAAGFAAAAAVLSVVCISNPAFAEQIPLIGHVFEELGGSLGFSGDYSSYVSPLGESAAVQEGEDGAAGAGREAEADNAAGAGEQDAGDTAGTAGTAEADNAAGAGEQDAGDTAGTAGTAEADNAAGAGEQDAGDTAGATGTQEADGASDAGAVAEAGGTEEKNGSEEGAAVNAEASDGTYSKTVDGVTVTLSEVYCNDAALYLSMLIRTEEKFPETMTDQQGTPVISLYGSGYTTSFNPEQHLISEYLDGRMIDDHTYAGVLRIDLDSMRYSFDEQYYEDKNAFLESLGITEEEIEADPESAYDKLEEILGVELLSDESLAAAGGPDYTDYQTEYEVPDEFTLNLNIKNIVGDLKESSLPEMPQELQDAYNTAMADQGLDMADYENFTEEEKDMELKLFNEMHNKYAEMYPETAQYPNKYENWWFKGEWNFEIPVTGNHEDTVVKEIQDTDENGLGIATVTMTPVEITAESILPAPSSDYFTVALDADGEILPYGSGGSTDVWAIQDRDVSKIDIYICDYTEYMDELKGYYWSDSYEEDKKTKTFKELLDERALHHTEVTF